MTILTCNDPWVHLAPRSLRAACRAIAIAVLTIGIFVPLTSLADDQTTLETVHRDITERYSAVQHMSGAELAAQLRDARAREEIVLFDVREAEEFAVSRLNGAERIEPGVWTSSFMRAHGDRIRGKTVVFYCSVGARSSYAASYLADDLKAAGATRVVNLEGGIFAWHNAARPLADKHGATRFVHPYDAKWGRYVDRGALTRYAPRPSVDVPPVSSSIPGAATQ
ncbi:MAG: rhodanese-like domain-containing protein [Pseudomonadota bacterium]